MDNEPPSDGLEAPIATLFKRGLDMVDDLKPDQTVKFLLLVQSFLGKLVEKDFLNECHPTVPTEKGHWELTIHGPDISEDIYVELKSAWEVWGHIDIEKQTEYGLMYDLRVDPTFMERGTQCRARIGRAWPEGRRDQVLRPQWDPFKDVRGAKKGYNRFLHAYWLVSKAMASEHKAMVLGRVIVLAFANGMEAIGWAALIDILTHAYCYEITWRNQIASAISIHPSALANLAFGRSPTNPATCLVGSTHDPFAPAIGHASGLNNDTVQVGHIGSGEVKLTHPSLSGEVLRNVHFSISPDAKPLRNEEPILMATGWAVALSHRPQHPHERVPKRISTTSRILGKIRYKKPEHAAQHPPQIFKKDIHGNPLYLSDELEIVNVVVKQASDGRLFGQVKIGESAIPKYTGHGVMGERCACTEADPKKFFDGSQFDGLRIENVFNTSVEEPVPGDCIYLCWTAGDLPMILYKRDSSMQSTYVQVGGECLYCATSRAVGFGCDVIIAGGL